MNALLQTIRILLALSIGVALGRILTPLWAIVALVVLSVLLPSTGAIVLRGARPEQVTWRNVLAGWLLPWGYRIANGRLTGIAAVSGVCWLLLGLAGFIGTRPSTPVSGPANTAEPGLLTVAATIAGWLVYGAAAFWLAGAVARSRDWTRPPGSTQAKLMAVPLLLLATSLTAWFLGNVRLALWVAAVPPVVAGVLTGAWMAVIILAGKNARWN